MCMLGVHRSALLASSGVVANWGYCMEPKPLYHINISMHITLKGTEL